MKMRQATPQDEPALLTLMRESFEQETEAPPGEWTKTETAIKTLLCDPQAGEAHLITDDHDHVVGYMIMCRGFSLDYGGYFTWIEETYLRKSEQGRFRDQRFSP
jgi:predicted N-acetyltransferase YhbS